VWHAQVVTMMARGYGPAAIAREVGQSRDVVTHAMRLGRVREAVARVQAVSLDRLGQQIADQILRDAPRNIAFLEQVRDADLVDQEGKEPMFRERVTAAMRLLDSQVPKRSITQTQVSGQVGVQVSRVEAEDISRLAIEAGVVLPAITGPDDATG
jgi:hypothetical protein